MSPVGSLDNLTLARRRESTFQRTLSGSNSCSAYSKNNLDCPCTSERTGMHSRRASAIFLGFRNAPLRWYIKDGRLQTTIYGRSIWLYSKNASKIGETMMTIRWSQFFQNNVAVNWDCCMRSNRHDEQRLPKENRNQSLRSVS